MHLQVNGPLRGHVRSVFNLMPKVCKLPRFDYGSPGMAFVEWVRGEGVIVIYGAEQLCDSGSTYVIRSLLSGKSFFLWFVDSFWSYYVHDIPISKEFSRGCTICNLNICTAEKSTPSRVADECHQLFQWVIYGVDYEFWEIYWIFPFSPSSKGIQLYG